MLDSIGNTVPQPQVISFGPATKLVSVDAVARELHETRRWTTRWLRSLDLPLIEVNHQLYVHVFYLELCLWRLCRPRWMEKLEPGETMTDRFSKEVENAGRIYAGISKKTVIRRLEASFKLKNK